jgi:transposase
MLQGFWVSDAQCERLAPLLPNKPRAVVHVHGRWVISGIVWPVFNR